MTIESREPSVFFLFLRMDRTATTTTTTDGSCWCWWWFWVVQSCVEALFTWWRHPKPQHSTRPTDSNAATAETQQYTIMDIYELAALDHSMLFPCFFGLTLHHASLCVCLTLSPDSRSLFSYGVDGVGGGGNADNCCCSITTLASLRPRSLACQTLFWDISW